MYEVNWKRNQTSTIFRKGKEGGSLSLIFCGGGEPDISSVGGSEGETVGKVERNSLKRKKEKGEKRGRPFLTTLENPWRKRTKSFFCVDGRKGKTPIPHV